MKTIASEQALTKSEVPTEDLKVSAWFLGHVGVGNIVIVESRVVADFFDSLCFPFASGKGIGIGRVKVPLFGFLTILGLVGLDWEEEFDDDEFFFWMRGER